MKASLSAFIGKHTLFEFGMFNLNLKGKALETFSKHNLVSLEVEVDQETGNVTILDTKLIVGP